MKSTQGGPSSNHIMTCDLCPKPPVAASKSYVWKYNMEDHYKEVHPTVTMDPELKKSLEPGPNELMWLENFAAGRVTPRTSMSAHRLTVPTYCPLNHGRRPQGHQAGRCFGRRWRQQC